MIVWLFCCFAEWREVDHIGMVGGQLESHKDEESDVHSDENNDDGSGSSA